MSYSYDQFQRSTRRSQTSSRRGTFSYWLPLAVTVTVAAVGIAAWVWSERRDDEEDKEPSPGNGGYSRHPHGSSPPARPPSYVGDLLPGETGHGMIPATDISQQTRPEESQSYIAKMSGALQRAPSPQEFLGGASRSVVAGVAAAGAVIGSALSSIREEDKNAYTDHKTWSEEAESRKESVAPSSIIPSTSRQSIQMRDATFKGALSTPTGANNGKRRIVAVVVSAESYSNEIGVEEDTFHEHASILSHLPRVNLSKVCLFVLIYAPRLKEHPLDASQYLPPSLGSSYSNIARDQSESPEEKRLPSSPSPAFRAIYSEALTLVEKESMVLPFTTLASHVHILRHLNPELVYLQESLAGVNGDVITHLQSWLRQDVILVVGAEGGHGGLADSESEAEQAPAKQEWWKKEERVGLGRGVIVVEGLRVGDDWAKRVEQKE